MKPVREWGRQYRAGKKGNNDVGSSVILPQPDLMGGSGGEWLFIFKEKGLGTYINVSVSGCQPWQERWCRTSQASLSSDVQLAIANLWSQEGCSWELLAANLYSSWGTGAPVRDLGRTPRAYTKHFCMSMSQKWKKKKFKATITTQIKKSAFFTTKHSSQLCSFCDYIKVTNKTLTTKKNYNYHQWTDLLEPRLNHASWIKMECSLWMSSILVPLAS